MKVIWSLVKVVIALCLIIPAAMIVLTMALGVLGALFGIAVMTLRLAVMGLIAYGGYRIIVRLMRGPAATPAPPGRVEAPRADPYYDAAMRELDKDLSRT